MGDDASAARRHIVIVGGGVVGASTAYFLTRHPKYNRTLHRITLLEASTVAAGASGKAGGLLALWAYPAELVPLSYRLHRELAEEHDGAARWGYRRVGCGHIRVEVSDDDLRQQAVETQVTTAPQTVEPVDSSVLQQKDWNKLPKEDVQVSRLLELPSPLPADLRWIDPLMVRSWEEMGVLGSSETAQVHPFHFTTAMAELAAERGVAIRLGAQVTEISTGTVMYTNRGQADMRAAETAEQEVIDDATDVVVAAGPWTGVVLPRSKVEGLRAHSVVWAADVSPYAVFTDVGLPSNYVPEHRARAGQKRRRHRGRVDPEIYARPFGEVYACGEPDSSVPLPATADQVACDMAQCADLLAYVRTFSPPLAKAPVKAQQACYLPRHMRFGEESGPLIGRTSVPGVWVASGHTCWGIQNSPATGLLMAEMLMDGEATSADVSKFDPRKFKV